MISHVLYNKMIVCMVAAGCLVGVPCAAAAATPGSLEETASASADLKPDQVRTGVLASWTPKIEMRRVETRVVINGEVRTLVHYVPYASDFKPGQQSGMKEAAALQKAGAQLKEKIAQRKRRKTALDKIILKPPAPVTREKPKDPRAQ